MSWIRASVLALLAQGCASEPGWDVPAETRVAIQEKLALLLQVEEHARNQPLLPAGGVRASSPWDASHVPLLTLRELRDFPRVESRFSLGDSLLRHCSDLATQDRIVTWGGPCGTNGDPDECAELGIETAHRCERIDRIAVLRILELLEPTFSGESYDGGYARGEVLHFAIDDARLLCGTSFEAESKDEEQDTSSLRFALDSVVRERVVAAHASCQRSSKR